MSMSPEQREALEKKYYQIPFKRPYDMPTWEAFLDSVQPTFGCDDAITVKWQGMWLCIETDGYCHT